MTLTQVWGALLIFTICPLLGGSPLIRYITYALTRRDLKRLGTGNISVSAAFYHAGRLAGILAVLSEAGKGIAAVLLARSFFPTNLEWEMIALIALVMGRYWIAKGAGTTNVTWGYIVHDPVAATLVFLIGGIGFTILRERKQGRIAILVLFPLMTALLHPQEHSLAVAAIVLAVLLGWIYSKIPDDLDMSSNSAQAGSQSVFKFFRGDRAVRTLNDVLKANKVGAKAATLSRLRRSGYPVPMGWMLLPGDDPQPLLELLQPSEKMPLVVRSSAIGEDTETASAAGQYETVLNITNLDQLQPAITRCLLSYNDSSAVQYRRDRALPEASMAVLIQEQVQSTFSGVAFSRDPIAQQGDAVVIEALPGSASRVVSGQVTPESYRVFVPASIAFTPAENTPGWILPDDLTLTVEGAGDVPPRLIQQVAFLARHLEQFFQGAPQDIEWTYDGQRLWLLQARPITTLLPIWTRKIASEVIPGAIRPLTWSINRPLTCGIWGELFTLVLGQQAKGLDFTETATLHYSHAYFNASLLGNIFRRMGLPAESLEFLTRGAKFSKPPFSSTLKNSAGLLRLLQRELNLEKDFQRDYQAKLAPAIAELSQHPASSLSASDLLLRADFILDRLKTATYYSILAPLSAALRKAIYGVSDDELDNQDTPEVAALRELQELARSVQPLLQGSQEFNVFEVLAQSTVGREKLEQFDQLVDRYGYLSEVGTDIAIPTWKEGSQSVRELFTQFCLNPPPIKNLPKKQQGKVRRVQRRVRLKGRVTEIYSRLLAELRWSFVALEQRWLESGLLQQAGDIFFLKFWEVRELVERDDETFASQLADRIAHRRKQFEHDRQLALVPFLVYGNAPPEPILQTHDRQVVRQLRGIAASPGLVEGQVKIVRSLTAIPEVDRQTILVVPYTDSGWAPLLARAGGLIAEVGGRLSHGAIVAREYRIPAVMDVHDASRLLHDGQLVRIDGQQGLIEIL